MYINYLRAAENEWARIATREKRAKLAARAVATVAAAAAAAAALLTKSSATTGRVA